MWNIDLTLVDVARVSRDAYAEAFQRATGRPPGGATAARRRERLGDLLRVTRAERGGVAGPGRDDESDLLARYNAELAVAFGARCELLPTRGRVLPGPREALAAVAQLPGVIQTVLTGTIKQNAGHKLRAFGLESYLDPDIGGFGSDVYPKGTQIIRSLDLVDEKYGLRLAPADVVYLGDSIKDVAAAKIARVRCVGIASGRSTSAELRDAGADPVLDDLADTARVVAAVSR